MNINDKFPILEQSKRIAELLGDSAPESQMVWYRNAVQSKFCLLQSDLCNMSEHYPAYDLAELGEMIVVHWGHAASNLQHPIMLTEYYRDIALWNVNAMNGESFPTEAQARAALLIHLLEQKQ